MKNLYAVLPVPLMVLLILLGAAAMSQLAGTAVVDDFGTWMIERQS